MNKKMIHKNKREKNEKPAFTLIEVITVLLVISLGMIGTLSLISQNIRSQSLNEKTMVAYQLAQEGIEMIRQVRDTDWIDGNDDWLTYSSDDYFCMDYTDSAPSPAASNLSDCDLSLDSDGMYYTSPGVSGSGFSRRITIAPDYVPTNHGLGKQKAVVTADVYWQDHGKDYSYSLETELYDWK